MQRGHLHNQDHKVLRGVEYWLKQRKLALQGLSEHPLEVCDSRLNELCQKRNQIVSEIYRLKD